MRRSVVLVTAAVGAGAFYARSRARAAVAEPTKGAAEWPPLEPVPTTPEAGESPTPTGLGGTDPVDGECPDGFPIKAKNSSRIYHSPGGRNYERTVPDRCFASPADAEAAGYRAPKS